MAKYLKIMTCLAIAVILVTFGATAVGCNEEELDEDKIIPLENCELVAESELQGTARYENFMTICNSYGEVKNSFFLHGYKSFDNAQVRAYINKHSKEKSLVVCAYMRSSYDGSHELKGVEVNDGTLTMYIYRSRNETADDIICDTFFIAGVDKTFVEGVTNCTYEFV